MQDLGFTPLVLQKIAPAILDAMSAQLSKKVTDLRATLSSTFKRHIELTDAKCSKVRTIFSGRTYIPLSDIYVNLYLKSDNSRIRDEDLVIDRDEIGDVVLSGTGGAGKTMLMKYLANLYLSSPDGKIPLFIELRSLKNFDEDKFYETIFRSVTRIEDLDKLPIFMSGLKQGLFVLMLDGLDEVPPSSRDQVFSNIQRIALDFPKTRVIASTRPEIETRNWESLTTYEVCPLNLSQAQSLISKVDFPQPLKNEFTGLLDEAFFNQHKTFLSIPLLCSLMLLTYHEYKEIPSRITVFYDQAFETLFRRHDLQKEGYFSRTMESGLPSDRFRAVFSAFCYRTLAQNELDFTDTRLREHLAAAVKDTEIEVDIDKYANDLVSAVCVIIRDGRDLHFMHRSFQEFFAAIYIKNYRGSDCFTVINRLSDFIVPNRAIEMAFDMDKKTIEREWALPAITEVTDYLKRFPKVRRPLRLVRKTCARLMVAGEPPETISCRSWFVDNHFRRMLLELEKIYPDRVRDHFALVGHGMKDGSKFCSNNSVNLSEPKTISKICEFGYSDKHSSQEFTPDEITDSWFEETSLHQLMMDHVESLLEFQRELKRSVSKRETISLLR